MFKIGDYIIYGNNGVCVVENIGELSSSSKTVKPRVYYTLKPCYTKGSKIFTPVDNNKVKMRAVMSKDEATKLIDDIKNIDYLWISDEKRRELEYKDAFQKCDCTELVRIIKTIYLHKQSRIAEGKKVTSGDEKYFRMAEDSLYGELAISLDMTKDDVKEYVTKRVETLSAK